MDEFGFERLDVYKAAIEFLAEAVRLSDLVPRGYASIADQLRRASSSIALNIAEGSGKFGRDQPRFYGIARGSALECAAILEVIRIVGTDVEVHTGRQLLHRIVAMLTRMVWPREGSPPA